MRCKEKNVYGSSRASENGQCINTDKKNTVFAHTFGTRRL